MKKNINKCILLFLIIIIMILIIFLIIRLVKIKNKDEKNSIENQEVLGEYFLESYGKDENGLIDAQSYFDVTSCIMQYLNTININSSSYYGYGDSGKYEKIDESEIKKYIYNLLSNKYIEKNSINIKNLYDYVHILKTSSVFIPLKMNMVQDKDIKSFVVYGLIETIDLEVIEEIYILVNIDEVNYKFSINPLYGKYNSIEEINDVEYDNEIDDNNINTFVPEKPNYETLSKEYINLYKKLALSKPELAYEYLDEQYKKQRFGNVEQFKIYINDNKDDIKSLQCVKYYVEDYEGYRQYVIMDKYGRYYIFRESSIMEYKVLLDTYTIDIPEFIEKYDSATVQGKVVLNIDRFKDALNSKDISYIYNKLSEGFKKSNFETEKSLKKYIENNLNGVYTIEYNDFKNEGDIYIYNITLTNQKKESNNIKLQIIMQLLENRDYKMSFSIEK